MKHQKEKAEDLQTFSKIIFLFASFLSLGLYIPDTYSKGKESFVLFITIILLSVSCIFYYRARKAKKNVEEEV